MLTVDPLSDLYAVLEGSALLPFLESKLQANSFLEICSHTSVYKCIVNIIRDIGKEARGIRLISSFCNPKSQHMIGRNASRQVCCAIQG